MPLAGTIVIYGQEVKEKVKVSKNCVKITHGSIADEGWPSGSGCRSCDCFYDPFPFRRLWVYHLEVARTLERYQVGVVACRDCCLVVCAADLIGDVLVLCAVDENLWHTKRQQLPGWGACVSIRDLGRLTSEKLLHYIVAQLFLPSHLQVNHSRQRNSTLEPQWRRCVKGIAFRY